MADLGYVRVDGKKLRRGYTTGSCAAAAAKAAALLYLNQALPAEVTIILPRGEQLTLPVREGETMCGGAKACVIKDGGDDPDVTNGLAVWAEVKPREHTPGILYKAGAGVGIVTKPGLQLSLGEPAINPVPRQMIEASLREVLPPGWGAEVTVCVPGGEQAARKTLNPKLGVEGGISILGTTGIVEPMSEEAFKASLVPQLIQAVNSGCKALVLVPGRIGAKNATGLYGIPPQAVAEMSNFVGYMLMECAARGIKEVLLMGHISKLIKVSAGIFHTHNRVADARLETLAAYCALQGMNREDLEKLMDNVTVEGALQFVEAQGFHAVYHKLAGQASKRAVEHTRGEVAVGTVLLNMAGEILGFDEQAKQIAAAQGWAIW